MLGNYPALAGTLHLVFWSLLFRRRNLNIILETSFSSILCLVRLAVNYPSYSRRSLQSFLMCKKGVSKIFWWFFISFLTSMVNESVDVYLSYLEKIKQFKPGLEISLEWTDMNVFYQIQLTPYSTCRKNYSLFLTKNWIQWATNSLTFAPESRQNCDSRLFQNNVTTLLKLVQKNIRKT